MKRALYAVGQTFVLAAVTASLFASCRPWFSRSSVSENNPVKEPVSILVAMDGTLLRVQVTPASTRTFGEITGMRIMSPEGGNIFSNVIPQADSGEIARVSPERQLSFLVNFTMVEAGQTIECVTTSPLVLGISAPAECVLPPGVSAADAPANGTATTVTNPMSDPVTAFKEMCERHQGQVVTNVDDTVCVCPAYTKGPIELARLGSAEALAAMDRDLPPSCNAH
jgi:hypothetical protein